MPQELTRNEKIELRKKDKSYKDRHHRKIEKFSDRFNNIFFFFLQSYRKGILTFGGSIIDIEYDKDSHSCRECFRRFDDGQFKFTSIPTRHPNIVKAVITAKKSWGLFLQAWTDGIVECSFTKKEILYIFESNKIEIPEQFQIEFDNLLFQKRKKYIDELFNSTP